MGTGSEPHMTFIPPGKLGGSVPVPVFHRGRSIMLLMAVLLCIAIFRADTLADEPPEVDEVRIGYFGPSDSDETQSSQMWRAAKLAVEKANREGGYRGKPFRLAPGWSKNPWGTGVKKVTRMVYDDKVVAIVGGIDGPSTHLAEQVVAKARLTLISPVATDRSVNLANVPWTFSIAPGDHLLAKALTDGIVHQVGNSPFVSIAADDHDSHLLAVELRKCFAKRKIVPRFHFDFRAGAKDAAELARRIVESKPSAAVLIAGTADTQKYIAALRSKGFTAPIFVGPAATPSENVVFPKRGQKYFPGGRPRADGKNSSDPFCAKTYDAVCLLVDAVRKSGLDRAGIRQAVKELSPYEGLSGTVTWDRFGGNTRAVELGTIIDGRVESFPPPDEQAGSTPR